MRPFEAALPAAGARGSTAREPGRRPAREARPGWRCERGSPERTCIQSLEVASRRRDRGECLRGRRLVLVAEAHEDAHARSEAPRTRRGSSPRSAKASRPRRSARRGTPTARGIHGEDTRDDAELGGRGSCRLGAALDFTAGTPATWTSRRSSARCSAWRAHPEPGLAPRARRALGPCAQHLVDLRVRSAPAYPEASLPVRSNRLLDAGQPRGSGRPSSCAPSRVALPAAGDGRSAAPEPGRRPVRVARPAGP